MSIQVFHRAQGKASEKRGATFTGEVWAEPILPGVDNVTVASVFFKPGSRTFWHTHELGQLLQVTSGQGWVCEDGKEPERIRTGDTVWIPPHTRHWHGADTDTFMIHTAISLGKSSWQEEVQDALSGMRSVDGQEG